MNSLGTSLLELFIPRLQAVRWRCTLLEFVIAFLLFLFLPSVCYNIFEGVNKRPANNSGNSEKSDTSEKSANFSNSDKSVETVVDAPLEESGNHPLLILLRRAKSPAIILLLFYISCVLAPINEELLFRGLFQGSLEQLLRGKYRRWRKSGIKIARCFVPLISILLPAICFAIIHSRSQDNSIDENCLLWQVYSMALGGSLFTIICLIYLLFFRQIHPNRIFGTCQTIQTDVLLGFRWFCISLIPVYATNLIAANLIYQLGWKCVPDPISLIPLAIVFGFLFYRTHRLCASITTHVLFNSFGMIAALIFIGS